MSTAPLVSVLMPAHNSGRFIDAAIASILEQSYTNLELVVLDDGSLDDSAARAAAWAARDSRVRALRNDGNRGVAYTRNRLFQLASRTSQYFAIMDSDDISMSDRIAHQVAFLDANPEHGLVGGHTLIIDDRDNVLGLRRYPITHTDILKALTRFNPIANPTAMLRRSVLKETGEYDTRLFIEDYDLWVRVVLAQKAANLDEVVLRYRISPDQMKQRHLRRSIRETIDLQRKWLFHPRLRSPFNIAYWCAEHVLLGLPESWVLALFKRMTYTRV